AAGAASSACARPADIPMTSIAVASLRNCISNSFIVCAIDALIPIVSVCVVIVCNLSVQCYACLLTFSLAECKDFAALLFIFAKCAAPFRGKNLSLHCLGAT